MNKTIIGIDISKHKFDVAYCTSNQKWKDKSFENSPIGFKSFLGWLSDHKVQDLHVVMEATGRYGEDFAHFLYVAGHNVSIVNPAQIKHYGKSLLRRTKTDKVDSRLIAEFAQRHELSLWKPLSPSFQSLKDQVRCLEAFKKDETQTSNRLESAKDGVVQKMLKERLIHIQKQISDLELKIKNLVDDDPTLTHTVELLTTIPGIGKTSAINLLAELPDLSLFKCAKQLAAFAGLNPSIKRSGVSVKGRESISKTGSRELRKIFFFPAMAVMRRTALKPFIDRLKAKGKKGKVIVIAVMRKLLHNVFGVLKTQTPFQNYA
jgi:transposase